MAECKYRVIETSFGGDENDNQGFLSVVVDLEQTKEHTISVIDAQARPGLITRLGRGVKSAVGGAINLGKNFVHSGQSHDGDISFVDICKKASKTLTKLHSHHGDIVVPSKVVQAMMTTKEILELKDICISVFGQHNCGKSTLLNALLGEELLPIAEMSETSVKIKVQHDNSIHRGVCGKNCPHRNASSRPHLKCCPTLQLMKKSGKQEIRGADAIYEYLEELNKNVRKREKGISEPPAVVLKVNIPLLADKVPHGWTVSLVDNPGFGEAKEHVVQLADASLVTSSAYIYLIQTENIGGTEAAHFFKELTQKDKSAVRDGRLVVGITKFDTNYKNSSKPRRGRRSTQISVETVKENMIASIKDATDIEVSDDTIVPLCGEWALAASRLANCLISDPGDEKQDRLDEAVSSLESYPHLSIQGGQEQSQKEAIQNLRPSDLIYHLEKASGISDLKSRIHYIVGNACVKVWATKLISEFQHYLEAGGTGIETKCSILAEAIADNGNDLNKSQDLYSEVMSCKESIKATAPKRKKRNTPIWRDFEKNYQKDLEDSKPQEEGKLKVRDLVKDFKDQCQNKISTKCFGPNDFESSIHDFLNESAPKLQKVFDCNCGFWNVQSVLMQHVEEMVERITKLRSNARLLCKMGPEEITESYRRPTTAEGRALSAPNLADIKLRVKIPSVSLRWWEKIIKFFRFLQSKEDDGLEKEEESWKDEETATSANNSIAEDRSSDSDDDDDCTANDSQEKLTDLQEINSKDIDKHGDHVSQSSFASSLNEDETDSSGVKQHSNSRVITYRKWTKELDDAISELQRNMEEECDKYFEAIKPKAIKFFYKDYSRKTNDRLHAFDRDFNTPLEEEQRRLKKLQADIDTFQKEYYELQAKNFELKRLSQQLLDAYSEEFARVSTSTCCDNDEP